MKIYAAAIQVSQSPNHFFLWGDEMSAIYADSDVVFVSQQVDDRIRVVSVRSLLEAPYTIRAAKTMRPYFQWHLDDIKIVTLKE